jgi:peptidyl-prolyl cis-trans isomerase SurA
MSFTEIPRQHPALHRSLTALALAAVIGLCGVASVRGEIIEEIAAFVNGQTLTKSELAEREAQVRAQLSRQLSGLDLESRFNELKKNILTDMIREVLLVQRAEIMGLDLEKIYKQAVDNLKQQQSINTNDEFKALLRQEGIDEPELKKILLKFNVPDIMINLEVRQKIVVTPGEVEEYFNGHISEFRVEETYKFREIVILAEGHEEPEMQEIAGKLQAELDGGLAFAEAVLKYSEAPSRFQEGVIGPLPAEDLAPELRDAMNDLEAGKVAGPIRMRHGLHYVQLEARTSAKEPNLEEVRAGIEMKLKRERFPLELEAYWKSLYEENRIRIKPIYVAYAVDIPRN